ncbi:addiction module protein [uncultured Thiohalocapsa sp.]|uniref:addiction module protein n=1 Tax=uncultured Thiohalocapsa sp. TaxID=768990 RepID=UPI0025E4A229|nr:addiction module protein [uncultured Thiohalocapsa sp.]
MQQSSTTVLSQALELPAEERAALVDELIQSLEEEEPDIAAVWVAEARDRLAAYRSGTLDAVDADEVFTDLRG